MNKIVMITGATSGIGFATARIFAEHQYRLILTGRRQDRLDSLRDELMKSGRTEVITRCFDVRSLDACRDAMDSLPGEWKNIDILINNAGLALGLDFIQDGDTDQWDTMIDTNIKGLLYVSRLVAGGMTTRKSGHIINLCSIAGKETYPKGNVYCATKFAVDALTSSMRKDLYTHNIRVSQVSPGMVEDTEFAINRFSGDRERADIYSDFNPLRAEDVAHCIHYIASAPPHVAIHDIVMMGTQQASATLVNRSGRIFDKH